MLTYGYRVTDWFIPYAGGGAGLATYEQSIVTGTYKKNAMNGQVEGRAFSAGPEAGFRFRFEHLELILFGGYSFVASQTADYHGDFEDDRPDEPDLNAAYVGLSPGVRLSVEALEQFTFGVGYADTSDMSAYSMDLREKVVAAYERGGVTKRDIAARFGVSYGFVRNLLGRRRRGESIAPKPHGGGRQAVYQGPRLEALKKAVCENRTPRSKNCWQPRAATAASWPFIGRWAVWAAAEKKVTPRP
ncbi:MAG: helix-turn-helix domain-containing protein [Deltaproteobacteria bacterium]|nr:helix-turn-helix domain-containing protein [Deltaproteobacteria bacterium]